MADYDVGAVSLSVPPASAVIQSYRPAVLVHNFGVHDALAVGSLRIYSPAGLLIFTSELYSGVIGPGESEPAQAVDYWLPPALGKYMVIAYVSCINDQDPTNDNLAPCFVTVTAAPPPPPPPVQMHASQHEEGGGDEVIVDGLHGLLTDPQTARPHKASHQAAGADQLDVTGLPGILAQGQPIRDHHNDHENGGGDEMNVDDLHGELYNLQKPKVHANEAHDPNYATDAELDAHKISTAPHPSTTNLEYVDNKDSADGYAGLDSDAHLDPNTIPVHANKSDKVALNQANPSAVLISLTIPASSLGPNLLTIISIPAYGASDVGPGQSLDLALAIDGSDKASISLPLDPTALEYEYAIEARIFAINSTQLQAHIEIRAVDGNGAASFRSSAAANPVTIPSANSTITITGFLTGAGSLSSFHSYGAVARTLPPV
jgi:hypothetical protein